MMFGWPFRKADPAPVPAPARRASINLTPNYERRRRREIACAQAMFAPKENDL